MSSRAFDGVNQHLRRVNMPAATRSFVAWGRTPTSGTQIIMGCQNTGGIPPVVNGTFSMRTTAAGATNNITAEITQSPVGLQQAVTTTAMVLNTWWMAAATVDSSFIRAYLNGGGKTATAHVLLVRNWIRHGVANFSTPTAGLYYNGQIAHVAAWSVVLTDEEILALYEARCPPMDVGVQPGALQYYAPLEHGNLCQFGEGTAGAQLVWAPQNSPTFSDEDPNVMPMIGGIVAA